jgi:hypothetical protein
MAITVTPVAVLPSGLKQHVPGNLYESIISLTFGAADTYVTGGIPLLPSTFGFNQAIVIVEDSTSITGGYSFVWNPTTQKLVCFSAPGTQLASASAALQNDIVQLIALGT